MHRNFLEKNGQHLTNAKPIWMQHSWRKMGSISACFEPETSRFGRRMGSNQFPLRLNKNVESQRAPRSCWRKMGSISPCFKQAMQNQNYRLSFLGSREGETIFEATTSNRSNGLVLIFLKCSSKTRHEKLEKDKCLLLGEKPCPFFFFDGGHLPGWW